MRGEKVLAAVFDPLDGPAEPLRGNGNTRIFGIEGALRTEAAADIGRDHADLVVVEIERIHQRALHAVRSLRRDVDREGVCDRIVDATRPRHSMKNGPPRCVCSDSLKMCAALANAASLSP
jgi:hypothetical protein